MYLPFPLPLHLRLSLFSFSLSSFVSLCLSSCVCLRVMLCCVGVMFCVHGVLLLCCGVCCVVVVVLLWCVVCVVRHAEKNRRKTVCSSQHVTVCRFKTSPCVPATRSHALRHVDVTRRHVESTHGGVLGATHGGVRARGRRGKEGKERTETKT